MQYSTLLAFSAACALVELTPGPNMTYLALLAADRGRKSAFAAVLGVALGLMIVGIAASLGLTGLIANSPFLYQALLWGGVGYFLWLAWETWQSARETSVGKLRIDDSARFFRRGLVTNLLNPKAAIFYVAVVPTFVSPEGNLLGQTIILSMVFVAIATLIHTGIILLAGTAQPLLAKPERKVMIRRGFALALVAIAFWMALSL
jgi:threonine/homoserine/homoserine lactone efflux protein